MRQTLKDCQRMNLDGGQLLHSMSGCLFMWAMQWQCTGSSSCLSTWRSACSADLQSLFLWCFRAPSSASRLWGVWLASLSHITKIGDVVWSAMSYFADSWYNMDRPSHTHTYTGCKVACLLNAFECLPFYREQFVVLTKSHHLQGYRLRPFDQLWWVNYSEFVFQHLFARPDICGDQCIQGQTFKENLAGIGPVSATATFPALVFRFLAFIYFLDLQKFNHFEWVLLESCSIPAIGQNYVLQANSWKRKNHEES